MIENLYLHIGRGKTGTSAQQGFLNANRDLLQRHGFHYVRADEDGRGLGHVNFAKSFIRQPPSYMTMPANLDTVRAAVATELATVTAPNVLLSSENFPLADVAAVARFLSEVVGEAAVKIIFFARSQDELAESQYNQMIKLGLTAKTFADFIETELDDIDFAAALAPWASQFGKANIIARVYDASGRTAIDDFLNCLDLSPGLPWQRDLPTADSANASVGYLALEMFRVLNASDFPQKRRLYPLLHDAIKANDFPPLLFDADEARHFRNRFRDSNEVFIREYLGRAGTELGGRKYSDAERDRIRAAIRQAKQR